jgi:hypothetical protein
MKDESVGIALTRVVSAMEIAVEGCVMGPQVQRCAWFMLLVALLSHDESPWFKGLIVLAIRSG